MLFKGASGIGFKCFLAAGPVHQIGNTAHSYPEICDANFKGAL